MRKLPMCVGSIPSRGRAGAIATARRRGSSPGDPVGYRPSSVIARRRIARRAAVLHNREALALLARRTRLLAACGRVATARRRLRARSPRNPGTPRVGSAGAVVPVSVEGLDRRVVAGRSRDGGHARHRAGRHRPLRRALRRVCARLVVARCRAARTFHGGDERVCSRGVPGPRTLRHGKPGVVLDRTGTVVVTRKARWSRWLRRNAPPRDDER